MTKFGNGLRGSGSLRDSIRRPESPPRPPLEAAVDRIMRQAERDTAAREQAARQAREDDTPVSSNGSPAAPEPRWKRDAERQIASLKLDGIEQVTREEYAVMTPEQIVKAREDGRLMQIMATPTHTDGKYQTSSTG